MNAASADSMGIVPAFRIQPTCLRGPRLHSFPLRFCSQLRPSGVCLEGQNRDGWMSTRSSGYWSVGSPDACAQSCTSGWLRWPIAKTISSTLTGNSFRIGQHGGEIYNSVIKLRSIIRRGTDDHISQMYALQRRKTEPNRLDRVRRLKIGIFRCPIYLRW